MQSVRNNFPLLFGLIIAVILKTENTVDSNYYIKYIEIHFTFNNNNNFFFKLNLSSNFDSKRIKIKEF